MPDVNDCPGKKIAWGEVGVGKYEVVNPKMDDKESFDYIEANLDGRKDFSYNWYHKSGAKGSNKLRLHNREQFLETINLWNKQYETSGFVYVGE